ncbi:MAG: YeiH family protein [Comamonas sp.]
MPSSTAAPSPQPTRMQGWSALVPGLMLAIVVALAATFVSEHYGGPKFLYALLMGVAFHFLSDNERCRDGVEFAAKKLVRFGVALLGCKIVMADVADLGLAGISALAGAVMLTIAFGLVMARALGLPFKLGLLSGGATGICGISAAMAISSTMVQDEENERYTLMTAIGIASLSTTAMVLYPLWVKTMGLSPAQAGLFLGGSIHDVAQVVGAGNIVSPEVAKLATLAKMFRVAMLVPVVLVLALYFRADVAASKAHGGHAAKRQPVLPFFLVAFILLVIANSMGWVPPAVQHAANETSSWALVISIAALGVKTSFEKIVQLGWQPIALLISETVFIAVFMALVAWLLR